MDELYREQILEHYKRPHNWGELEAADLEALDEREVVDRVGVVLRGLAERAAEDDDPEDHEHQHDHRPDEAPEGPVVPSGTAGL